MKELSYFFQNQSYFLHTPIGRTMVLFRCIRHESGFHTKPTTNVRKKQNITVANCLAHGMLVGVVVVFRSTCFLWKLRHICLNFVWTLNIERKYIGCLRSIFFRQTKMASNTKNVATPKAKKMLWEQNKSKNVCFKANSSEDVCKNQFSLPTYFHFCQWAMCNMEANLGLWHNSKFKKHHGFNFKIEFQATSVSNIARQQNPARQPCFVWAVETS